LGTEWGKSEDDMMANSDRESSPRNSRRILSGQEILSGHAQRS